MATMPDTTNPIYEAAERLARLGISTIPILPRTKEPPVGFHWGEYAKRLADASERYEWFVGKGWQIAVVAGPVSGHLIPLDYDGLTGFETHANLFPILRTFPRVQTGSGKAHVWVRPTVPTQKYNMLLADGSKLEVRANTHYTVCPPSIHPSGQPYRWLVEPWAGIPVVDLASIGLRQRAIGEEAKGEPIEEGAPLTEVERDEIVKLVTPHYIPDQRHYLVLALAGWLANLEVPQSDTGTIVKELARNHQDTGRLIEYERAVRDTYKRAKDGYAVAGWARLTDTDYPLVTPATAKRLDLLLRSRMPEWTFTPGKPATITAPQPAAGSEGRTLADLKRKRFANLKWVVEGLVPEGALLLCGRPKSKKSWLALGMAISVSLGSFTLGAKPTLKGDVLYLDLEGNQRRIRSRVTAILGEGQEWPDNFWIYVAGEWPTGADGLAALEQWFLDHPRTNLVVIDVLQDFRPPIGPKENGYDYDRNTLKSINQLAEKHHASVILIHHTRKAKGEDMMDEVSGTLGAPSAVATIWTLNRATDGRGTILKQKGRDLMDDDDLLLSWDVLAGGFKIEGPAEEVKRSDERKAILDLLPEGKEMSLRDIAAALEKSTSTTGHLLAAMASEGLVEKVRYGTYARTERR